MRVLVSGFGPFDGETINPSLEVVRSIVSKPPPAVELEGCELTVRRNVIAEVLLPRLEAGGFDLWLGLGQAGGREEICVERVGLNLIRFVNPDGSVEPERPIRSDGPDAYLSGVDVDAVTEAIQQAGAPARVSYTAGTFLCNQAIYTLAHAGHGRQLFLHLPYLPEQVRDQGTAVLPLSMQVVGVRAALGYLTRTAGSNASTSANPTGR